MLWLRRKTATHHVMGLNRPLPQARAAARESGWQPTTQLLDLVPLTGDLSDIQPEEYTRQVVEAMISYAPQLTPTRCEQALISTAVPASYQAGSQWPTGKPTVNLASAFRNVRLGWLVEEGLTNKAVAERRRSGRVPPVVRGY